MAWRASSSSLICHEENSKIKEILTGSLHKWEDIKTNVQLLISDGIPCTNQEMIKWGCKQRE